MSRDHAAAKKFRDVVAAIARAEIEKRFPQDRYAQVVEIHTDTRRVVVQYNGEPEDNLVTLPYNSVQPAYVGQWVRVGGAPGDRHVVDTLGGSAAEDRVEEVLSEPPVMPKWAQMDDRMVETAMISSRPDEFEILTIGHGSLAGSVLRVPGTMSFSKVIIHLARGGTGSIQVGLFRINSGYDAELVAMTPMVRAVYNVDQHIDFEGQVTLDRGDEILVAILNRTGETIEASGWKHKAVRRVDPQDALTYALGGQTTMPELVVNAQWSNRWTDRVWYMSLVRGD